MASRPDWTPFLEAGMEFSALTRAEARRRAEKLVKEGQLAQERAQAFVDDMVESSRRRADELLDVVRSEFQRQVESLGIATKEDLARLEAKLGGKKTKRPKDSKGKRSDTKKKGASAKKKSATKKSASEKSAKTGSGAKKQSATKAS